MKKIVPQTQKNKELTSMAVKIDQMSVLVQLQKVILWDYKETFMKSMDNTRNFHNMFGKSCLVHSLLYLPVLLSASDLQEKMEKLLG